MRMPIQDVLKITEDLNSRKWMFKFSEWTVKKLNPATKNYEPVKKIGRWQVNVLKAGDSKQFHMPDIFHHEDIDWWLDARFSYRMTRFSFDIARRPDGTWLVAGRYSGQLLYQSPDLEACIAKINSNFAAEKPSLDDAAADKAKTRDIHKEYIKTLVSGEFNIRSTGYRSYSLELPGVENHMTVLVKTNDSENQDDWSLHTKGFAKSISLDPVIMTQLSEIYKRAALKAAMASV